LVVRPFGSCYLPIRYDMDSEELPTGRLFFRVGRARVSFVERNRESVFFVGAESPVLLLLFYLVFSSVSICQPMVNRFIWARLRCQNSQSKGLYYTRTPGFAQAETRVNTREFCTTSNNGKDFMFNCVSRVLTRTRCVASTYHNQNVLLLRII